MPLKGRSLKSPRTGAKPLLETMSVIRGLLTLTSFVGAIASTTAASAEWTQPLRSAQDAAEFCRFSEPRTNVQDLDAGEAQQVEAYETERRSRAQRPVVVLLSASAAPVIGYDRTVGTLGVSLYQPATFVDGYRVQLSSTAAEFELAEATAEKLRARFEAGTASLRVTFLPLAWSDTERPLCREVDGAQVLDGELLEAHLVDEVGQTLASYKTELGREIAMMREHRIQGYLDSAVPVVTVSSLSPFPSSSKPIDGAAETSLKAALRSSLYGCYLRGLTRNARLQGALVVHMKMDPSARPRILVDSLHSDDITGCATQRIEELVRVQRTISSDASLKATVIFKLDESPGM